MDVENTCAQLIDAVNLIMNPSTPAHQRAETHKMLEEFKDNSTLCAKCGFLMSSKGNPSIIRHFGLRLIDNYIKLHWNEIVPEEKLQIKNIVLEIIANGTESVTKEEPHIKDALSRIVVEVIKREWPQQWPSLLDELHVLCVMGDIQKELVLLIFLRLTEDVVQFQNVPDKRRREVYKTLCGHLKDLFEFFIKTLTDKCVKYYDCKDLPDQSDYVLAQCRVAQVGLETLSSFVEWVPVYLITENTSFLKLLCKLLDDGHFQMHAAKCLLNIVERKGKHEDRKQLLILFEEDFLFNSTRINSMLDEKYYLFLKLLCQVLVTLGTNLCFCMSHFPDIEEPNQFPSYLNCLLLLTKHPSVVISHCTQSLWLNVLRHPHLSQSTSVQQIIPLLLKCEAAKLLKIGYPSEEVLSSSAYSLMDYDSDEDFELGFYKLRADVNDVIRLIAKLHPKMAFNYGSLWLKSFLNEQDLTHVLDIPVSYFDKSSVWDAVVHYLDALSNSLTKILHLREVEELSKEGLELLQLTINFNSEDPVMTSFVLSCTSALFCFVTFSSECLLPVINKIFSHFNRFLPVDTNQLYTKEVLNLRRHACSLLIKLCSTFPKLLMPIFDQLCQHIKQLLETPDQLSQHEKSALLESLMILSNELNDYDRQLNFLNHMVSPITMMWLAESMKMALSSPDTFIAFIGLDLASKSSNEKCLQTRNRSDLMLCLNVLKACAKRCRLVSDPDVAENGNFIHPFSSSDHKYYRNPAAQCIVPTLEGIFLLLRILNSLHDPTVHSRIHPDFSGVLDLTDTDKNSILGISCSDNSQQSKLPYERMKIFLQVLHEGCLHILGDAIENLHLDFFRLSNYSKLIVDNLFYNLQYVSDNKLRLLIRIFLKPLFLRCPSFTFSNLVNVLSSFSPFMFQKLSVRWECFKQRYGSSIGYEEQMTEIQEVLEDQLNRLLTREYILFLGTLLHSKYTSDSSEAHMDEDIKEQPSSQSKILSELGLKIFQSEVIRPVIVCTIFNALHWLDSVTNVNCVALCDLIFRMLVQDGLIRQVHEANYLLQNILYGLQELGEHECNQGLMLSLALNVYETLKPKFPTLDETLISSVNCSQEELMMLDQILHQEGIKKAAHEKLKKEKFKQVIRNIIGKNIGQHHKKDIVIKNLPPLLFKREEKNSDITSYVNDIGLCQLFSATSRNDD